MFHHILGIKQVYPRMDKTKTVNDRRTILHIHAYKAHDISMQMALCDKAVFFTARYRYKFGIIYKSIKAF